MVLLRANEENLGEYLGVPGVCELLHKIVATDFSTSSGGRPARNLVCLEKNRDLARSAITLLTSRLLQVFDGRISSLARTSAEKRRIVSQATVNYAYEITSAYNSQPRGPLRTIKSLFGDFPCGDELSHGNHQSGGNCRIS